MTIKPGQPAEEIIAVLEERAKELNCLYEVEEILNRGDLPLEQAFQAVARVMPKAWQYPEICRISIEYENQTWSPGEFSPTEWMMASAMEVQGKTVGYVSAFYLESRPMEDFGPFLKEERRLLDTVADRLGHHILFQKLKDLRRAMNAETGDRTEAWRGPLRLLEKSDRDLYARIARRMMNHLCWMGVGEALAIMQASEGRSEPQSRVVGEANSPARTGGMTDEFLRSARPFELAAKYLRSEEILLRVQRWFQEDKASAFIRVLETEHSAVRDVADALRRFHLTVADGSGLSQSTVNGLRVSLIRRFLSTQLEYIMVAKEVLDTRDFESLMERVIAPAGSLGRLGGKSAGIFLARRILEKAARDNPSIGVVLTPRTWYIASDGLWDFILHNDLMDIVEQKYKPIDEVRHEYPNIVQLFKNSRFPPETVKLLQVALDDLGEAPLVVRSSSLLEDRLGTAFSGKYKSLFLANRGSMQDRLRALMDAIAEIYASTFGPDPIEYRRERGLLDFHEEMAVLIQEVVGTRMGRYYMPAFAGVAFSRNEFRWSPRIQHKDGLLRLVPGLGTRAVDRVGDDYPVLASPGQPGLKVNQSIDEVIRYSPRKADVINLETNDFETVEIRDLLGECGAAWPAFAEIFSVIRHDMLERPSPLLLDMSCEEVAATFNGLVSSTDFVPRIAAILKTLEECLGHPVDIEFAHDGKHFHLLQCRPQNSTEESAPAPIPKDLPARDVVFTARKFISNGWVPDITHVVYVDPTGYSELPTHQDLVAVGRAVSKLNKMLPKRQFILMGPGRWGSRGDIKLGVSVTYSDINNTAVLIEICRRKNGYMPDLSFGTHFFQDLVESSIRYIPLYPDDEGIRFDHGFFAGSPSVLSNLAPEFQHLDRVVRVIDVPSVADGRVLRVLMNADLDEAAGILATPAGSRPSVVIGADRRKVMRQAEDYWSWRMGMAERIAASLDPKRFGVVALYVIGSTKNATAGPASDIDLLVHFAGSDGQRKDLLSWLEGWSLALAELNYQRTGYRVDRLLDVHIVTDEDIAQRSSFAVKIGAVTDPAKPLPIGE